MPLQNIIQPHQPVGLQLLGNTISGAATDYANKRRVDELQALQRSERLADVASQRNYEDQRFDKMRALQVGDEQRRREEALTDAESKAALEMRLRNLNEAARLGLFDITKLGDEIAEGYALEALANKQREDVGFEQQQRLNAQGRIGQFAQTAAELRQRKAAIEALLNEPAKPDREWAMQRAVQLATEANAGKTPNRAQIDAAGAQAMQEATQAALVRDFQEKEAARYSLASINSELASLQAGENTLANSFRVSAGPSTAALSTRETPAATDGAPRKTQAQIRAEFLAELDRMVATQNTGSGAGTAGAASPNQRLRDLSAAERMAPPEYKAPSRQAKTNLIAGEYEKLDAPVESASAELADIDRQLQALQKGVSPFQSVTPSPLNLSPEAQSSFMTELLLKRAAAERRLQENRAARTTGKTSLLSTIPAANTPFSYTPNTTPSPGLLVSGP